MKLFMNYYRKILLLALCCLSSLLPQQSLAEGNHCVLLVYHHFADDTPKSTSVTPALFHSHLRYLKDNDFEVLPLEKVITALKANTPLPDKCVSLTADDGYQSIYDNTYPLLEKFKMPMAVFVASEAIDQKYSAMITWAQLREMADLVSAYNHSISHPHLVGKSSEEIVTEITGGQARLRDELGTESLFFAYPYGEFDETAYNQLKTMGYVAFGQQSGVVGSQSDFLNLPRFAMAGSYAKMSSFALKVNSLPMPVTIENPKSMIISEGDRPLLTLNFSRAMNANERYQFACFVAGQERPEINWLGADKVTVRPVEPLTKGRSRYNCTTPSNQKGRYYWYSKQWLTKAD